MQWLDEALGAVFLVLLAVGAALWLVAGLIFTVFFIGDLMHAHTMRRLRGPVPRTLRDTGSRLLGEDERQRQDRIRYEIQEYGAWDSSRGLYVARIPDRGDGGGDVVRCYAWARPHYVLEALRWSPVSVGVAAVVVFLIGGSYMAPGLRYGFEQGGLEQALEDKYGAHVAEGLPPEPAPNQVFEGVTVSQYGDGVPGDWVYRNCTINAAGGIDTLTVVCPDDFGGPSEIRRRYPQPKEWF